jgi:hypothetical protein
VTTTIYALRQECQSYPRESVFAAVNAALLELVTDPNERRDVASIVTAWLLDDVTGFDAPPMSDEVLGSIQHELRRRTH